MALPTNVKTRVDLQVSGSGIRVIALQEAVKFAKNYDHDAESVIETAKKFETYLEEGSTDG